MMEWFDSVELRTADKRVRHDEPSGSERTNKEANGLLRSVLMSKLHVPTEETLKWTSKIAGLK